MDPTKKDWRLPALGCLAVMLLAGVVSLAYGGVNGRQGPSLPSFVLKAYALSSPTSALTIWGTLLNAARAPITGSQNLNFSLYDSATLVTSAHHIYCETQSQTLDASGDFVAQLGSGTGCTGTSWSGKTWPPTFATSYWLQVIIGATSYGNTPFTASPYFEGNVTWGQIINFPSDCGAGSAAIGAEADAFDCAAFMESIGSTSTACAAGSFLTSLSASATTIAGGGCGAPAATTLVSTSTSLSCAAASFLNSASISATLTSVNAAFGCTAGPATTIGSTSCASGADLYSASLTTVACSANFIPLWETSTQSMSAVALAAITGCTFALAASTTYYIDVTIPYAVSTATDGIAIAFADTSLTAASITLAVPYSTIGTYNSVETATSASTATSTGVITTIFGIHITGYVTQNSATTLGFLFAVKATAATTSTVTVYGCFGTAHVV